MRRLVILLLFATSLCFGQSKAKDIQGAWILTNLNWVQSKFHNNQKWTSAEVLCFFQDGRFGIVKGTIMQTDDHMEISYGDSQSVYYGNWKQTGDGFSVVYKVIYRDIDIIGGEKEKIEEQEPLTINSDGKIVFQGKTFQTEPRLNESAASTITEKLPHQKS